MPTGGPQPQQVQETTNKLGPEQKAIFDLAFPKIGDYAATVPERYQGSTIAGFNPNQVAGQDAVLGATGAQQNIVSGGANASNFWTGDDVWSPANNSMVEGAIDAAVRPITQAYTQDYLPGVRSEAIKTGGVGGSRQGIHEVLGAEKMYRAVGDTAGKVVNDNYSTNVNAQLKALGLLPQTAMAQTIPGVTRSGVGDVQQAQEQAFLNETVNNFTYDQIAPYLQGKDLLSIISGMPGGTTVSTANNPPGPNKAMSSLSGAAAGATLGSALFPGVGTIAGAGIGGIMPFLLG